VQILASKLLLTSKEIVRTDLLLTGFAGLFDEEALTCFFVKKPGKTGNL